MKKKKKNEDKDKPLKHITVYFDEGNPIKYETPSDCTVDEENKTLNIQLENKSIVYNMQYVRAYEFEEEKEK